MTFQGNFFEGENQLILFGSFFHIPKDSVGSAAPGFEHLVVSFNIKDPETQQNRFINSQDAYIFINQDKPSIGEVVNQQPQTYKGEPWISLKQIVLDAFQKMK
jgi:hypothetical protein